MQTFFTTVLKATKAGTFGFILGVLYFQACYFLSFKKNPDTALTASRGSNSNLMKFINSFTSPVFSSFFFLRNYTTKLWGICLKIIGINKYPKLSEATPIACKFRMLISHSSYNSGNNLVFEVDFTGSNSSNLFINPLINNSAFYYLFCNR